MYVQDISSFIYLAICLPLIWLSYLFAHLKFERAQFLLTHFHLMFYLYTLRKHQKISWFLKFSGDIQSWAKGWRQIHEIKQNRFFYVIYYS